MHMANELLSVPVAAGTFAIAAAGLGVVCRKAGSAVTSDKLPLMGIMGAFIFAAQMVNFQLPIMPGTSGHMIGAVLLAIILGPYAGAIVISSVVIIQCLIFQDGGLLALGCNIINMALVPSFIGYYTYKIFINKEQSQFRLYLAGLTACLIAMTAGAVLVPIQAALSGVLKVPFTTFLITMIGVYVVIGITEGLLTAAVLVYIRQVRPQTIADCAVTSAKLSRGTFYATLLIAAIVIGAGLSLYASPMPDGLEYSYAERPDQPDFESIVSNESQTIAAVDDLQSRYSPLPGYTLRASAIGTIAAANLTEPANAWTSFAAVIGSAITMAFIWLTARAVKSRSHPQNAPCTS